MIVTRFAPAPSGRLQLGNIRTALHNWLLARKGGGRFLLRIDDTDAARSSEEAVEAIRADLAWLGLVPDDEVRQSARFALYERWFETLRASGRIYPAYESAQELELKRKVLAGRGLPPIYDRAALRLSDAERATLEADGIRPHWRFKLDHAAPIAWDDAIRGRQSFDPAALSDPVIRRADGSWLYMLPSAIDDIDLGITDVIRGEDHVSNTALQIQMFGAMGAAPPRFAHEALLVDADGGKLSKRLGSAGVDAVRDAGIEPPALLALLARIGTSDSPEPIADPAELASGFDLSRFGRAPARFAWSELEAINARMLHVLPFEKLADRLPAGMDARIWKAIRPNLATLSDAGDWWRVIEGPVERPSEADPDFYAVAAQAAERIDWTADPWHALAGEVRAATGRAGRMLFLPLRRALTGRDHGPDMASLLPLIGRERAIERLRAAAA